MRPSTLCFFCDICDETSFHIFYESDCGSSWLWNLVQLFGAILILPSLTPQTAVFGIPDSVMTPFSKMIKSLSVTLS